MAKLWQHSKGRQVALAAFALIALTAAGVWAWTGNSDGAQSASNDPFVRVTPEAVSADEWIDLEVVNPTSEPIIFEPGGMIEKLSGDEWVPAEEFTQAGQSYRLRLLEAPAGESRGPSYDGGFIDSIRVPDDAAPGQYRILKPESDGQEGGSGRKFVGTFTVVSKSG